MPWRSPACRIEIQHHSTDTIPDRRDDYRSHLCRRNLRFDPALRKMVVAPLNTYQHVSEKRTLSAPRAGRFKPRR